MKFAKNAAKAAQAHGNSDAPAINSKFLKKGSAAKELYEKAEAEAEVRKAQAGKMFRFRIKEDEEHRITFLDGDMNDDGMIEAACYYEHTIQHNGTWKNYVCTADDDEGTACPICAQGTYGNYFAAALTVLDHTPYKIKKGENAGKIIQNSKKLFVMKLNTYKQLSKLAAKRGGLAGCTFDVSRSKEQDPAVGGQFDFVEKIEDGEVLMKKYDLKAEDLEPANYAEEIVYLSPDELVAAGIGTPTGPTNTGIGKEKALTEKDFSNEL